MSKVSYAYVDYDLLPANELVTRYLIQSCAKFMFGSPMISPWGYEQLGKALLKKWNVCTHPSLHTIDRAALKKGLPGDYLVYEDSLVNMALQEITARSEWNDGMGE